MTCNNILLHLYNTKGNNPKNIKKLCIMKTEELINQTEGDINDNLAFITQSQKQFITEAFNRLREEIPFTPENVALEVVKTIYDQSQDNPKMIEGLFGNIIVSKCTEIIREVEKG